MSRKANFRPNVRSQRLEGRRLQGFNDSYEPNYQLGFAEGLEEGRQKLAGLA